MKPVEKTPFKWVGGKSLLVKHILPLIPKHDTYIEPFFGGGAVWFAKPQAKQDYLFDLSPNVLHFWDAWRKDYAREYYETHERYEREFLALGPSPPKDVAKLWWKEKKAEEGYPAYEARRNCSYYQLGSNIHLPYGNKRSLPGDLANFRGRFEAKRKPEVHEKNGLWFLEDSWALYGIDCNQAFAFIDPPYENMYDKGYHKQHGLWYKLAETLKEIPYKCMVTTQKDDYDFGPEFRVIKLSNGNKKRMSNGLTKQHTEYAYVNYELPSSNTLF